MLLFLVNVIRSFLALSLMAGLLLAYWRPRYGSSHGDWIIRTVVISICAGLASGVLSYVLSLRYETVTAARVLLDAAGIGAAVISSGVLFLHEKKGKAAQVISLGAAALLVAALAASSLFSFLHLLAEQALSAITVLNTDLILNIGGILLGAGIVTFVIPLVSLTAEKSGKGILAGSILVATILLVIPWSAEILLGLMRLETAEVTSARLTFVAKATKYAKLFPYVQAFMVGALSLLFFMRRTVHLPDDLFSMQRAERRKARGKAQFELRWFKSALVSICVIMGILLSYDLYASRPVKITPPVRLAPDAAGLIKIKIDDVKDGKLHRYSYVTDDGHVVRFILINRAINSPGKQAGGQTRIGVVYDACMLCGDMGYIQQTNEVICIACNVRVFTPSIGKAGGCNPIPLVHAVEGESVVISVGELDKGARYFSEVVSIRVKDPVTGKEMDNLKAPFRAEYKGRTYFFESEETQQKFLSSPETYIGVQQSRYERAQGYQ